MKTNSICMKSIFTTTDVRSQLVNLKGLKGLAMALLACVQLVFLPMKRNK